MAIARSEVGRRSLRGRALTHWRAAISLIVVVPLVGAAAALLSIVVYGLESRHAWMFLVGYVITGLGVTVGYHRLFTHHSFKCGAGIRLLLGVLGSMAMEGPVKRWVADHRLHHQHSDTEHDLHSPHHHGQGYVRALLHAHCGWFFDGQIATGRYARDLDADPLVGFVDRHYWWWVIASIILPGVIDWYLSGQLLSVLQAVLIGGLARICFLQHITWAINSIGHSHGSRDFETADRSVNNVLLGVLAFGEGWHNNHHAVPHSACHGFTWWQFDASWLVIRGLAAIRLVWDVQRPRLTIGVSGTHRP